LGQAGFLSQLILRPSSLFTICGNGRQYILHSTHPLIAFFVDYIEESLQLNHFERIIYTTNKSSKCGEYG